MKEHICIGTNPIFFINIPYLLFYMKIIMKEQNYFHESYLGYILSLNRNYFRFKQCVTTFNMALLYLPPT